MITRETDYAIRVIIRLGEARESVETFSVTTLADELGLPYRFLRKICRSLVETGLLSSVAGRGGGLKIARPAKSISLLDIIDATNSNSVRLNECLVDEGICPHSSVCVVHASLNKLQNQLNEGLASLTIEKLIQMKAPREKTD
ncbi:MAG: Rrf2 family transcriptional regulator [Victivallales bacterium]|nr:Rrf2 family transcriptional regulator [Victivallales bacterium]